MRRRAALLPTRPRARRTQRGAALLTAMMIVTLVATLAAAMIWQQWRSVQVEAAERARAQAQWILLGAVDWARLILREDARTGARGGAGAVDHLGEPWALPLAEAKLSTFLAADKANTEDAPEAFLSGQITDAQSRYNLRNLVQPTTAENYKQEERTLSRLMSLAGASGTSASSLALALRQAAPPTPADAASAPGDPASAPPPVTRTSDPPLLPERIEQLAWLGLDAETIRKLSPYVTLLPVATPVNVNTAPKEVLAAVANVDPADAERLVQARQRTPFRQLQDVTALLPREAKLSASRLGTRSDFFEIRGRLRLQDRVVEERALVQRNNLEVIPLQRERVTALDTGAP
jgi:general secretion pathway protein K